MRESDIRDLSMVERFFRSEDEWLRQFADEQGVVKDQYTVQVPCPCCGSDQGKALFVKHHFHFERCQCGTIYVNPRFDEGRLNDYYATRERRLNYNRVLSANNNEEFRIEEIFVPRVKYIRGVLENSGRSFEPQTQLLDIGCASGQFLSSFQSLNIDGPKLFGVEASGDLALIAQQRLPGAKIIGLPFRSGLIEAASMDIVTLWEVIEHIFDPHMFLKNVANVMKPGAHLFLSVPNIEGFDIQILWDTGNAFSPPSHLNYFNKSTINKLMERVGLAVVDIVTPGKLDVDIVRNRIKNNSAAQARLGEYLTSIFLSDSKESNYFCDKLQELIHLAGRSSHMVVTCRKL